MLFFPGQAHEQYCAQVAHQLHLGPLGLQGENVVLIEQGHSLQRVVVPGVVAGMFIWHDVQQDLHNSRLSGQVLRLGGHAIEGIPKGDRPGQVLEGLACLALKIKMAGGLAELEGGAPRVCCARGGVCKVDHLVVGSVVGHLIDAVEGIALYHAALQQVSVIIQGRVICLVVSGDNPVVNRVGGHGQPTCARHQPGQHQGGNPFFAVLFCHESFLLNPFSS